MMPFHWGVLDHQPGRETIKVRRNSCKLTEVFFWGNCLIFSSTSQTYTHLLLASFLHRMRCVIISAIDGLGAIALPREHAFVGAFPLGKRAVPQAKLERTLYALSQTEHRSHMGPVMGALWILLSRARGSPLPWKE